MIGGLMRNERVRRAVIFAGALLAAFLVGLVPMWFAARERNIELQAAQAVLRVSRLQNLLANAAVDSGRGEYEMARQTASDFFTNLRGEIERGDDSALNAVQRQSLLSLLDNRDELITLLARGDAESGDRLTELYLVFRHNTGDVSAALSP